VWFSRRARRLGEEEFAAAGLAYPSVSLAAAATETNSV
jgi:hypothetical protein